MALADEGRSACVLVWIAADENAQKSKPNGQESKRENCCGWLTAAAAKPTTPRFTQESHRR
jgi:hypothetical protein